MVVLDRAQIRERIDLDSARVAVRDALVAHAHGAATPPAVMHLDLGGDRGDLHVKGAWRHGASTFTIKVAGSFAGANTHGLPPVQGLSLVLDATTGAPIALLADGGWLTELRTGAAGALAVDLLGPPTVQRLAILGTGGQARFQLEAIARVRTPASVVLWGRRHDAAQAAVAFARDHLDLPAETAPTASDAVLDADVVVTTTAARAPLVAAEQITPTVLIVAVGADTPGKQELDPSLLTRADLLVVDDIDQCTTQGELQHAPTNLSPVTLGALLAGLSPLPPRDTQTVVDLTGLGVQDAAVAELVLRTSTD